MTTAMLPVPVAPLNVALNNPLNPTVEFSFDNISDQLFKKVQSCVYDLRTGRLGVLRAARDAYAVFVPGVAGKKAEIQVCPVTAFGLPIPAYAIRTPIEQLEPGDVVIVTGHSADTWLYFLKSEKDEQVENPSVCGIRVEDGVKTEITLSETLYAPGHCVLCVKNVIGKQTELAKMLPMLALLGSGGRGEEGKDKLSKLILCLLMGGGGIAGTPGISGTAGTPGTGLDMKSMLPMLMLNGGGDDMLMTTMLLGGGLFGK